MDARIYLLAACMMHVEGGFSIKSLAHQNNNPGNIEDGNGKFLHFTTMTVGFAALASDIMANQGTTLRNFLAKYAPPLENDTTMYLTVVSTLSGIGQDEVI
jgi:hypothetical protein